MEHLAILSKHSRLLAKILSREKTIESRWYKFKKTPYKNIAIGDTIYFKESGEPVTLCKDKFLKCCSMMVWMRIRSRRYYNNMGLN